MARTSVQEGRALLVEVGEHRRYGAFLFGDECKAFVELRKKIALDLVEQVGLASVVLVKSSAVYLAVSHISSTEILFKGFFWSRCTSAFFNSVLLRRILWFSIKRSLDKNASNVHFKSNTA